MNGRIGFPIPVKGRLIDRAVTSDWGAPLENTRRKTEKLTADLYTADGDKKGTVELAAEIFGIEPNTAVMHQVVTAQLAAARAEIDQEVNRAREALRVMEEAARFILDDAGLTAGLKTLRSFVRILPIVLGMLLLEYEVHPLGSREVGARAVGTLRPDAALRVLLRRRA
mgnify:CR=1 FL=1